MRLEANQCHVAELQIGALMWFLPSKLPLLIQQQGMKCRNSELLWCRRAVSSWGFLVLLLLVKNLWGMFNVWLWPSE